MLLSEWVVRSGMSVTAHTAKADRALSRMARKPVRAFFWETTARALRVEARRAGAAVLVNFAVGMVAIMAFLLAVGFTGLCRENGRKKSKRRAGAARATGMTCGMIRTSTVARV